ncbi:anti-repressor SinI family protein [Paenibacillus roseipurpureus]|uniref:Anti-repressor SinI family protein n=1 Tax=Paenibacillus roseopurpureus TaxID=2918901 RepID=A0AA96LZ20_9BACL|nr:anti-repressor SinI family protein [Paenibacillus sp. MBLB1832]WNR47140.1 anti-repressor SinI family protein [Paenibacillus sp. MBLB1832]
MVNQLESEEFDAEWIHLIVSARKMGLTMEDIRAFLRNPFTIKKHGMGSNENDPCLST